MRGEAFWTTGDCAAAHCNRVVSARFGGGGGAFFGVEGVAGDDTMAEGEGRVTAGLTAIVGRVISKAAC